MKQLTPEQIKEIAEQLDFGFDCYFHKDTGELLCTPAFDNIYGDEDLYADEIEELEKNFHNYIKIEKPESHDNFEIMDDFADQLDDGTEVKTDLIRALNRRKPFSGFKNVIDNSGVYRQQWFDFKDARMRQYRTTFHLGRPGSKKIFFIILNLNLTLIPLCDRLLSLRRYVEFIPKLNPFLIATYEIPGTYRTVMQKDYQLSSIN